MYKNSLITVLALTCLWGVPLHASASAAPDKFRIALGAYAVSDYDSTMSLTDNSLGAGVSISPNDTLGLNLEQTVTRLEGYYRFTPEHALTYSWYKIRSEGNRTIDEEFEWTDQNGETVVIPVGAQINTGLDYEIFKLGYLWSFYHNEKIEVSAGAGLHLTRIGVDLAADLTQPPSSDARDVRSTVPLPVLSFALKYHVTPRFSWFIKSEVFAISIEDWTGSYTDANLGMEYRALDNVGLGVGLGRNAISITEEGKDDTFDFDNRISGINLYVAAYF